MTALMFSGMGKFPLSVPLLTRPSLSRPKSRVIEAMETSSSEISTLPTTNESSTQTEDERMKFNISPQDFKSKATAVLALYRHWNNKIDASNIGISVLSRFIDKDQLLSSDPQKSAEYLFSKTIQLIIEGIAPERLIPELQKAVKDNDLLVFALNLVKNNGAIDALSTASKRTTFLGAYCFALDCFLKNSGNPCGILFAAQQAHFLHGIVTDIISTMVGVSYGSSFIAKEILDFPDIETTYKNLFE
jgi:hypothetical protein